MVRIWLNHWFNTAYSIIQLIKNGNENFQIIGSSENEYSAIKNVCDEWYAEPILKDKEYADFCLNFCIKHQIDVFLPRRGMLNIIKIKNEFENSGVKVMADDYEKIYSLNHKSEAYDLFKTKTIGYVPDYRIVTNVSDFKDAYDFIKDKYAQVCFKFVKDEGGKSFRLIDNNRKGYTALFKKQNTRMTLTDILDALSEREEFSPLMVMPFLNGNEVSIDCLNTPQGLIMLPRVKDNSKIERLMYDSEIMDITIDFQKKIGLECPYNIQFKYLNGIPYFLEVNTRMSGGIHMACAGSGVNIPNIAVKKLLGIRSDWFNAQEEKMLAQTTVPIVLK